MYYFQCFPSLVLDRVWEYSSHSENWLPQKTSKEGRDCKQLYLRFLRDGKQTQNWQPSFHFIYFSETKHFVAFGSQTHSTCGTLRIANSSFFRPEPKNVSSIHWTIFYMIRLLTTMSFYLLPLLLFQSEVRDFFGVMPMLSPACNTNCYGTKLLQNTEHEVFVSARNNIWRWASLPKAPRLFVDLIK